MNFHDTQDLVAKDNTQFRVVACGRQWGKTTLACWEMTACAYAKGGRRIAYFATTFGQARDIAWNMLKDITRNIWYKPPNETRLELYIKSQDGGISEILLKGFESVETSRGTQYDLIVLDEVAKMRSFKEGWQGVLLGTLAFRQGKALFISTPYGFNHFFDLYELGQSGNPLYKSWKFTSFDNPYLSREYLQSIQDISTVDFWSQEYLADFRRFTGLIYKEFSLEDHVRPVDHIYNENADYYFGLDFAVRGYTASLGGYVKPDGILYIPSRAEYKELNKTAIEHSTAIRGIMEAIATFDKFLGFADPAGFAKNQQGIRQGKEMTWSIADEYIDEGFPLVQANNEVNGGINYVRQLFKANKIVIDPSNTKLIDEILQYQWKEQSDKSIDIENEPEKVRKVNDHLVDALRYMAYSKPEPAEEIEPKRTTVFPAVFPLKIDEVDKDKDQFTELEGSNPYE